MPIAKIPLENEPHIKDNYFSFPFPVKILLCFLCYVLLGVVTSKADFITAMFWQVSLISDWVFVTYSEWSFISCLSKYLGV